MFAQKLLFLMLIAAATLSACAGLGGTFTIDRFLDKEITGDTASACMARSYQAWARNKAWVQKNYAGAVELAERAEAAKADGTGPAYFCSGPDYAAHLEQHLHFRTIMQKDPVRACACGNAVVEFERWSCAKPGDDKEALKRRFDAAAAACEGR